jgi:hypothetical protein
MNKEENLGINYRKLIWVIFFLKKISLKENETYNQVAGKNAHIKERNVNIYYYR